MSIQSEKFLPQDYQFEEIVRFCGVEVRDWIEGIQDEWLDVIDPQTELDRNFRSLYALAASLGREILKDTDNDDSEALINALYRGMVFGLQVADKLQVRTVPALSVHDYLKGCQDGDICNYIIRTINEYLGARPEIDSLIYSYAAELDASEKLGHIVEMGAGMMLLLSERTYGEYYFRDAMEAIEPDDFSDRA